MRYKTLFYALFSFIILTACTAGAGPSTSLKLTMTDFAFAPNTLTVPAGQEITITAANNGAVSHDFMIMKLGQDLTSRDHVGAQTHVNAFWEQDPVPSGQTVQSTFVAPTEPGAYQIVCGIAGHLEAGMVGKLIVVPSP